MRSQERPFWQARYYDFNVWTARKRTEKLKYIHRNPVSRGLVEKPEDWAWSSYRHYMTGVQGTVEIESLWTEWRREHGGSLRVGGGSNFPPRSPKPGDLGHPD